MEARKNQRWSMALGEYSQIPIGEPDTRVLESPQFRRRGPSAAMRPALARASLSFYLTSLRNSPQRSSRMLLSYNRALRHLIRASRSAFSRGSSQLWKPILFGA
jgi:hypothetical protein